MSKEVTRQNEVLRSQLEGKDEGELLETLQEAYEERKRTVETAAAQIGLSEL